MNRLLVLPNYFLYKLKSTNEHGVHSPFVFDLVTNVIYNNKDYYCYKSIENQRKILLDSTVITDSVSISLIGKKMLAEKYSKLMFRLVNCFQPNCCVLVTDDFGIDSAYIASVSSQINIYAFCENRELQKIVASNFKQLKLNNITLIEENISTSVPNLLKQLNTLDFVVIKQQTQKELLSVFYQCLENVSASSVIVISNIGVSWDPLESTCRHASLSIL